MATTFGEMRTDEQKEIDEEILQKVQNGIRFLERTYGPDWIDQVDLNTLQLSSASSCVLGQLYQEKAAADLSLMPGGYWWAVDHLEGINREIAYDYGFNMRDRGSFEPLQKVWETQIRAIRSFR